MPRGGQVGERARPSTTFVDPVAHATRPPALRPARVLVIEDEFTQREVLLAAFDARGMTAIGVDTAARALEAIHLEVFDVILLDLGLPDLDGVELCQRLRVWTKAPIIVVSADAVEQRMVEVLDHGADDYVVKPFGMSLLMARVRVALRHAVRTAALVESEPLSVGDVTVDIAAHVVTVDGTPVDVSTRQFSVLVSLMRNAGRIVTYTALARVLWGYDTVDHDLNSLRISVSRLRQQIGEGPRRPSILNERDVGYRLVPPPMPTD